MPRIVTGAISHETSTFTPVATTWDSYRERHYLHGADIIETFRGTNTPTGGFIEGAGAHRFELIPTVYATAYPSGPTPAAIFTTILGELLDGIHAAGRVDGVLLELHGSMVAEGIDDADGHILAAVRSAVGPKVPVVGQLDIHSNMSSLMIDSADVLIGRETYPEVDMAERGRECADVLARIVTEGLRPTMALHQVPMVWGTRQVTAHPPMREAIARLHAIEARPGVVCGSIATCYALADVPDMGASVYIVTDNDRPLAQRHADDLGRWIFERRADWHAPMPSTQACLRQAQAAGRFPVIFADWYDNTGGGSPGDSTGMLRTFIEAGLTDACILYIVDRDAVDRCHAAGAGAVLDVEAGGKSSPLQGMPVKMRARVVALSDGRFRYDGPMYSGLENTMGPSAHIEHNGVHVLLVSKREQPFDTAFARTLGLDPRRMTYIGVKSAAHFRSGFEAWAGAIYEVSEPSVHNPATGALPFRRLGRTLYPFNDI